MLYSTDLGQIRLVSQKAADFLETHDIADLPAGRYELGGDDHVNVIGTETKERDEARYETHEVFMDIQVLAVGREAVEVLPKGELRLETPYDEATDIAFYSNEAQGRRYILEPGCFMALMPEDGHMPDLAIDSKMRIVKAVFKIKVG